MVTVNNMSLFQEIAGAENAKMLDLETYPIEMSEKQFNGLSYRDRVFAVIMKTLLSPIEIAGQENLKYAFLVPMQLQHIEAMQRYVEMFMEANQKDRQKILELEAMPRSWSWMRSLTCGVSDLIMWGGELVLRSIENHHGFVVEMGCKHRRRWLREVGLLENSRYEEMARIIQERGCTLMQELRAIERQGDVCTQRLQELRCLEKMYRLAFSQQELCVAGGRENVSRYIEGVKGRYLHSQSLQIRDLSSPLRKKIEKQLHPRGFLRIEVIHSISQMIENLTPYFSYTEDTIVELIKELGKVYHIYGEELLGAFCRQMAKGGLFLGEGIYILRLLNALDLEKFPAHLLFGFVQEKLSWVEFMRKMQEGLSFSSLPPSQEDLKSLWNPAQQARVKQLCLEYHSLRFEHFIHMAYGVRSKEKWEEEDRILLSAIAILGFHRQSQSCLRTPYVEAFVLAMQNERVTIIFSSEQEATQELAKHQEFFARFGITTSLYEEKTQAVIVYSAGPDLQFEFERRLIYTGSS